MMTSNEVCDSILDVDDVQTLSNIYDDDGQSWLIITPYLGNEFNLTTISLANKVLLRMKL